MPFAAPYLNLHSADKVSFRCKREEQNSTGLASTQYGGKCVFAAVADFERRFPKAVIQGLIVRTVNSARAYELSLLFKHHAKRLQ